MKSLIPLLLLVFMIVLTYSTNGQVWKRVGDVPETSTVMTHAVQLSNGTVVGVLSDGRIMQSVDEGQSWSVLHNKLHAGRPERLFCDAENTIYVLLVQTHPGGVSPASLFRSRDMGVSWTELLVTVPGYSNTSTPEMLLLEQSGLLCCKTFEGVFFSSDKGETWKRDQAISDKSQLSRMKTVDFQQSNRIWFCDVPSGKLYSILPGEQLKEIGMLRGRDPETMMYPTAISRILRYGENDLVGLSYSPPYVFRSTNGGETWDSISYNLPKARFRFLPQNAWYDREGNVTIAVPDSGLFHLAAGAKEWQLTHVPEKVRKPYKFVKLHSGSLLAFGYGLVWSLMPESSEWKSYSLPTICQLNVINRLADSVIVGSWSKNYIAHSTSLKFKPFTGPKYFSQPIINDSSIVSAGMQQFIYSTDAGASWENHTYPDNRQFIADKLDVEHSTVLLHARETGESMRGTGLDDLYFYSTDLGAHWTELTTLEHIARSAQCHSALVSSQQILMLSEFATLYRSTDGGKSFQKTQAYSEEEVQARFFPGPDGKTKSRLSFTNPVATSNRDILYVKDSVLLISRAGSVAWENAQYQPPKSNWSYLKRIVLHQGDRSAELLVLRDKQNRICVSVAGQEWKELESDAVSLADLYVGFTVGSVNDNSIELLAISESDGLWATTITGINLFKHQ